MHDNVNEGHGFGVSELRPEQREVQIRQTCGDRHWWYPAPQPGALCLCGKIMWEAQVGDGG